MKGGPKDNVVSAMPQVASKAEYTASWVIREFGISGYCKITGREVSFPGIRGKICRAFWGVTIRDFYCITDRAYGGRFNCLLESDLGLMKPMKSRESVFIFMFVSQFYIVRHPIPYRSCSFYPLNSNHS